MPPTLQDMSTATASKFRLILYLGAFLAAFYLVASIRVTFKKGLRKIPGPLAARFSGFYRFSLVYAGNAPLEYRKVHQKYGPLVRVGPNHVSISDPNAIPQIYGIGSNYVKVIEAALYDLSLLTCRSLNFMTYSNPFTRTCRWRAYLQLATPRTIKL